MLVSSIPFSRVADGGWRMGGWVAGRWMGGGSVGGWQVGGWVTVCPIWFSLKSAQKTVYCTKVGCIVYNIMAKILNHNPF